MPPKKKSPAKKGKIVTIERTRKSGTPVKARMGKAEEAIQKGQKPVDAKKAKAGVKGFVGAVKKEIRGAVAGLTRKKPKLSEQGKALRAAEKLNIQFGDKPKDARARATAATKRRDILRKKKP